MLFGERCGETTDKLIYPASPVLFLLALVFVLLVCPAGAMAGQAVVKEPVVNLRSAPGTGSSIVAKALQGESLEVLGKEGDWYRVGKNGVACWVAGWLVEESRTAGPAANQAPGQAVVKEPVVNLRSAPGTGSSIVAKALQGESLEVLGKEGDWYRVGKNGAACWVAGWLVEESRTAGPAANQAPGQASGQVSGRAVVKETVVNLRSAPGTGSSLVGEAAQGESLEVLGKEGDWYRVGKNGVACWVAGWLVEIKQDVTPGSPAQAPTASGGSAAYVGEVTEDGVNIRSGPGTSYNIVGQAGKGNKYSLLDKSGDWYKININSGSGWISGQYVKVPGGSVSSREPAGDSNWAVINGIGVNIRNGPGTSYQVVTRANTGDRFLLADKSAEWYKVVLNNGKLGWVAGWLVDVEKGPPGSGPRPGVENPVGRGQQLIPPPMDGGNSNSPGENPAGRGQQLIPPPMDGGNSSSPGGNPAGTGKPLIPPPASGGTGNVTAAVLKTVSARVEGGSIIISARAEKGPISYEITSLNDPDRLVIDLKGLKPGQVPENIAVTSPLAGGIRVGWFSKNPNVTRIVVDLKSRIRYERSLSSDASQLQVVLTSRVSRSLSGATIVLDPGHGGSDPGAIGPSGLKEKDVNLAISLKAAQYLRKEGATVILTRTGDSYVDLAERPNVASTRGAALFVSIHSNANPSGAMNGTTTYFLLDAAQGMDQVRFEGMYLAKYLQSSLVQALRRSDRGVLKANFLVLVKSKVPAALVEVAFMSNSEEEKMLRDGAFQDKAAQSIAKGIADYLAAK